MLNGLAPQFQCGSAHLKKGNGSYLPLGAHPEGLRCAIRAQVAFDSKRPFVEGRERPENYGQATAVSYQDLSTRRSDPTNSPSRPSST